MAAQSPVPKLSPSATGSLLRAATKLAARQIHVASSDTSVRPVQKKQPMMVMVGTPALTPERLKKRPQQPLHIPEPVEQNEVSPATAEPPKEDSAALLALKREYAETVAKLLAEPFFQDTDASEEARTLSLTVAAPESTKAAPPPEKARVAPIVTQTAAERQAAAEAYSEAVEALLAEPFFEATAVHAESRALAVDAPELAAPVVAEKPSPATENVPESEPPTPEAAPTVAASVPPMADLENGVVIKRDDERLQPPLAAERKDAPAEHEPPATDATPPPSAPSPVPTMEPMALENVTLQEPTLHSPQDLALEKKALQHEKAVLKKRRAQERKAEAQKRRAEARAMRVRRPIGVTLIAIISAVVVFALGCVTLLVSYFITQDVRTSAEENNLATNTRTTADCENRITSALSSVDMFLDLLINAGENETEVKSVETMFFERNKTIVAIYLPKTERLFVNTPYIVSHELTRENVQSYFAQEADALEQAQNGSFELLNASPFFAAPILGLFEPAPSLVEDTAVALLYSTEELSESFAAGTINLPFFVNNDGQVLVHSDAALMMEGVDESRNPIVRAVAESSFGNRQITYRDEKGEEYIGAFHKLSVGNGSVITVVKTAIVLEGINATTRRNMYIMFAILSLAIMVIYFFSKTLSAPLKQLTSVVNEINKGNFNTELFNDLQTGGKDEIGALIKSTKHEREILNMFSRLTNKGVTKAVITKQIDFEPHLKDITIFFSDIRGFTAISDGFKARFGEKSAGEIIGFLNDYMSRMVSCIRRTGGIVDKFEGDAIMACWGVLRHEDFAWERSGSLSVTRALQKEAHDKYIKEDALSAITSCVAMRYSLLQYNKDAAAFSEAHKNEPEAQYKPQIRMGAGLNSGRVTVGFMGSYDKMEFTSIGDAVNLASRTEASNKPCGTDVLLTQDTYDLLKKDYIRCEANDFTLTSEHEASEIIVEQIPVEFEVKGKGKQHFYGVVNMPNFDIEEFFLEVDPEFTLDADCARSVGAQGPKTLREMRALLGIPEPDFGQVNLDAEENKIQVAKT